jgi:acyl-CoA synthetase (AMP-forming)/AMP-acid ligase II
MVAGWRDRDDPAVLAADVTWSGGELLERAAGAAARLRSLCEPGAVPALVASSPAALAYLIGGADCGRPLAPLGPRLTVRELVPCVERLPSAVILADAGFESAANEVAEVTGRKVERLDAPPRGKDALALRPEPDEPAFWLHTSGTTGVPKAVPYTQWRLARRSAINAALCALQPGCVYASASGFHHIAGLGNYAVALAAGAALAPMPRFTVESWRALGGLHVTHALTVPTMLEMLLEAGALPLPGLKTLQYGAAPIHPDTLRQTLDAVPNVGLVNIYGQTEGSPITCLTSEDHRRIREEDRDDLLLSVGRAAAGVEMRIETPDAAGIGEVWARADHLFVYDPDGWLRTGDFGRLDGEGYLFLSGRRGDKIIRGGENIYPIEVERVLEEHPGVREAAVIGIPDRRWGQIVRAVIVPAEPGTPTSSDDLRRHVRNHLAGFKVPAEWVFTSELPRNSNGKVVRRALPSIS